MTELLDGTSDGENRWVIRDHLNEYLEFTVDHSSALDHDVQVARQLLEAAAGTARELGPEAIDGTSDPQELLGTALDRQFGLALLESENERFEDGVRGTYGLRIQRIVADGGPPVINLIGRYVESGLLGPNVVAETVSEIGRGDGFSDERRELVERALGSTYPSVRDAAATTLDSLSDSKSRRSLKIALRMESLEPIRATIRATLQDLDEA